MAHWQHSLGEVVIHHINCLPEGKELVAMAMERLKVQVEIVDIGPVVGMHEGPRGDRGSVLYAEGNEVGRGMGSVKNIK